MEVDFQILKRYLEGKGKNGDKQIIISWFSDIQAERDLRKQYLEYWNELVQKPDNKVYDGSTILDRIYHKIKLEESSELAGKRLKTKVINIISRVAAILFIPVIVSILIYRNDLYFGTEEVAYSEIYSPLGTRTQFYLPDGSSGWLNGGSYLEFPLKFKEKTRAVVLRGEAFFDVRSNPKKPFIVKGDNIEVVAHGTSFNVMAYPTDQIINVTLVNGHIDVSWKKDGSSKIYNMTNPGYSCSYDLTTSVCKTSMVDINKIISWKDGRLVFRDEPFDEVVRKINRWYNVNIIIKDNILESYTYLATFEDETLDEVLKLLKLSAPIDYKDIGRKIREDGTFEKRLIELYFNP